MAASVGSRIQDPAIIRPPTHCSFFLSTHPCSIQKSTAHASRPAAEDRSKAVSPLCMGDTKDRQDLDSSSICSSLLFRPSNGGSKRREGSVSGATIEFLVYLVVRQRSDCWSATDPGRGGPAQPTCGTLEVQCMHRAFGLQGKAPGRG